MDKMIVIDYFTRMNSTINKDMEKRYDEIWEKLKESARNAHVTIADETVLRKRIKEIANG